MSAIKDQAKDSLKGAVLLGVSGSLIYYLPIVSSTVFLIVTLFVLLYRKGWMTALTVAGIVLAVNLSDFLVEGNQTVFRQRAWSLYSILVTYLALKVWSNRRGE